MRLRVFVICAAVLILAFGAVGYYVLSRPFSPAPRPQALGPACTVTTTTGTVGLDPTQIANAATIAAVGIRRKVPEQAIVVALAAALQESKLENLPAGDRDSVGLFQQRPSQGWGAATDLQDPRYAAGKFYTALLKVKGWQAMRVTEAAQRVQRSAFPEAYEQWAPQAAVMADALAGQTPGAVTCTKVGQPASRGPAAVEALGAGFRLDWGDVTTTAAPDSSGLTVPALDTQSGWQYAHWLVAHSIDQGVAVVHYGTQQWTAESGVWKPVSTTAINVVAEVYQP